MLVSISLITAGLFIYFSKWTGPLFSKPEPVKKMINELKSIPVVEEPILEKQPLTEPISTTLETPHEATIIPGVGPEDIYVQKKKSISEFY